MVALRCASTAATGRPIKKFVAKNSCSVRSAQLSSPRMSEMGPLPIKVAEIAIMEIIVTDAAVPETPVKKAAKMTSGHARNNNGKVDCENIKTLIAAVEEMSVIQEIIV